MKITAVRLDAKTKGINEVKLEDGQVVTMETAIQMFKEGKLDDMYHVGKNANGEFLATDRDAEGKEYTNLKDMVQF